jgi:hypothetical protein
LRYLRAVEAEEEAACPTDFKPVLLRIKGEGLHAKMSPVILRTMQKMQVARRRNPPMILSARIVDGTSPSC